MILAAKRLIDTLCLLAIVGALTAVLFVTNASHVAALDADMTHSQSGSVTTDCATFCTTRASGANLQQVVLTNEEVQIPDPLPVEDEPYYVRFQQLNTVYNTLDPSYILEIASIRPPDIVRLTANFRF